jgi:hypothetical protein
MFSDAECSLLLDCLKIARGALLSQPLSTLTDDQREAVKSYLIETVRQIDRLSVRVSDRVYVR